MKFLPLVTSVLWFVPMVLLGLIAFVMFRRGLANRFPVFFTYTLLLPTRDFALACLPYPGPRYSSVFWWGEAVAVLLALGVIVETIWHLIEPYPFLRIVFRIFWIVGILASVSAVTMLLWANGPRGSDLVLEWIILSERSARFLQVSLLTAVILLLSRLGLTWHNYSVGIAAGFGIYSALDLALLELRAHLHLVTDATFVLLRSASYNLAVLIWTIYFLRPRIEIAVQSLPSTDLTNWNEALTEHVNKWYRR